MSRTPRKSSLTSSTNPQIERQSRRINRQQKQLDRQMLVDMGVPKVSVSSTRSISLKNLKRLTPLTDTQHSFFDAYEDGEEAFVLYGSAGSGKSTLAIFHALQDVLEPESVYKKLIIIRSTVQTREMGFMPGDEDQKLEPFISPYQGICEFLFDRKDAYEKLVDIGKIEFVSSAFLRGTTFNDAIIVVDENQSMTWHELSTICTRVGANSKIIFCGDYAQNDLITKKNDVSGFREFLEVSKKMEEFRHFRFGHSDIVRSGFCKSWIIASESCGL